MAVNFKMQKIKMYDVWVKTFQLITYEIAFNHRSKLHWFQKSDNNNNIFEFSLVFRYHESIGFAKV